VLEQFFITPTVIAWQASVWAVKGRQLLPLLTTYDRGAALAACSAHAAGPARSSAVKRGST
jgi:hypothetical protein